MRNYDRPVANNAPETHITSLIVQCDPGAIPGVSQSIAQLPEAEIFQSDPCGKIVVILGTATLHRVTEQVDRINAMNGVVTSTLVFHQIEETASLDLPVENSTAPDSGCQPTEASR